MILVLCLPFVRPDTGDRFTFATLHFRDCERSSAAWVSLSVSFDGGRSTTCVRRADGRRFCGSSRHVRHVWHVPFDDAPTFAEPACCESGTWAWRISAPCVFRLRFGSRSHLSIQAAAEMKEVVEVVVVERVEGIYRIFLVRTH